MKKVLTVLLAIAVMFTFSFGSAFAATQYSAEDYETALQAEKTQLLSYMESAKLQAVNDYYYNDEAFTNLETTKDAGLADGVIDGYQKAALEAAADAAIEDAEEAIDEVINEKLGEDIYPTADAPAKDYIKTTCNAVDLSALITKAGMKAALEAKTEDMNKAQLSKTKEAILAKTDIDLTKYNSEEKDYYYTDADDTNVVGTVATTESTEATKLTAADAISALVDALKSALSDADALKKTTDAEDLNATKLAAYEAAYAAFDAEVSKVETLDDEDFNGVGDAAALDKALNAYVNYGYTQLPVVDKTTFADSDATVDWSDLCTGDWKAFWEGRTKTSKDGELFGVAIKNNKEVTRSEASAVYAAMKAEIDASKKVVEAWANAEKANKTNVASLYEDPATFLKTLRNAMDAADTYADVVKYGDKLKATYWWGVKQYDDAKVDAAVKAAEKFVYGDLDATKFEDPDYYIAVAANDINDNTDGEYNLLLEEAKYAYDKFVEAVEDAAEKMYKDGLAALDDDDAVATKKVSYGAEKTADEDLVYLLSTYYVASEEADWRDIAQDALVALKDAQSYADIDAAMKAAADEFDKLLKDADYNDVNKAREAYKSALPGFIEQTYELLDDQSDYKKAFDNGSFNTLKAKGEKLINDANTVEAVKAAYAEAQALVTAAKSDDELKDLKKTVEKQITALPVVSKITSADADAVKAAYAAYAEYIDLAGADEISNKTALKDKYNKVNELIAQEIEDAAEALYEKMDDVDTWADADMPKYLAYKDEAKALVAKGNALKDEIDDVNEDAYITLDGVTLGEDYAKIDKALSVELGDTGRFYDTEIENAQTLLIKASKPGATAAEMQAALDAFSALTERQQYELDGETGYYVELAKNITDQLGGNVKALKITAKSTAKKGSITVSWTVKGDANIDGYEIWKSTKQSKGYKKAFTTTKTTYKNTKNLKKGTRYYFKVRAYKIVDGVKLTSDWSNKAYRVAK